MAGVIKRIGSNDVTDATLWASTFYGLEALQVAVSANPNFSIFLRSNEKLLNDIIEYQNKLVAPMAQRLYDYIVLSSYGELRHCAKHSKNAIKGMGFNLSGKTKVNDKYKSQRNCAYENAVKYNPEAILELAKEHFSNSSWDNSYGGEAWGRIATLGLKYGKIPHKIFCDNAFSLSHNTSPFLDKIETGIFSIRSSQTYKNMLDVKFEKAPEDTIEFILNNCIGIDESLYSFIKRAINLHFLPENLRDNSFSRNEDTWVTHRKYLADVENMSKKYKRIKFGNTATKVTVVPKPFKTIADYNKFKKIQEGVIVNCKTYIKTINVEDENYEFFIKNMHIFESNLKVKQVREDCIIVQSSNTGEHHRIQLEFIRYLDVVLKRGRKSNRKEVK